MVRTKANNAAVRKAVAAKAPRKNLGGGPRTMTSITSPTSRRGKRSKSGSSSNPVRSWPTPEWQKGIDIFLSPNARERPSSSSDGACSSRSTATELETRPVEPTPQVTSDGEEMEETESTDESTEEDDDLIPESEEESEIDEEDTATSKIAMLSKDLVCASGDDDDD